MAHLKRKSWSATITSKCDEREPPIWKSPFPREQALSERSNTDDLESKLNENKPMSPEEDNDLTRSGSPVKKFDAVLIPTVRQDEPIRLNTQYTSGEWENWNCNRQSNSDTLCDNVDRLIQTGTEKRKETQKKLDKVDADSRKGNSNRSLEIHLKKNEVRDEHKTLLDEHEKLAQLQNLTDEILEKLERHLEISKHCLFERDKREGIDLAHDLVEKELLCEVDIIKNYQIMFQDSTKLISKQQEHNRDALHRIEVDTIEKENQLQDTELPTGKIDHGSLASDQVAWLNSAIANIQQCRKEIMPSKTLIDSLETLINDMSTQVLRAWNTTNKQLVERINETREAMVKLQSHLDAVKHRINGLQGYMEDTRRTINSDQVVSYQQDQKQIDALIDGLKIDLKGDLYTSGDYLEQLQQMKLTLEEDIAIKKNTLFIDREKVRPMRKNFPLVSVCGIRVNLESDISNSKLENPNGSQFIL